uniref:Uncharacterized protein n=1 Tax=viral metagenome TaxID=1070528 RepID=A0A6C0E261_9ZZZZ
MNQNIIQQITIDCLVSKEQKKQMLLSNNGTNLYNKKDKRFYRRRILNLTKEMLLNNYSDDLLWDVKESFNNYVKTCIGYFKIKDETDIIQEDYHEVYQKDGLLDEITSQQLNESDDIVTPEEADKLMMRSIKLNKLPLDDFVTVVRTKPIKQLILPKQKDINLQDIKLKQKGIVKKNNIHTPYKSENENKKEDIP